MSLSSKLSITDVDLKGKRVLIRVSRFLILISYHPDYHDILGRPGSCFLSTSEHWQEFLNSSLTLPSHAMLECLLSLLWRALGAAGRCGKLRNREEIGSNPIKPAASDPRIMTVEQVSYKTED